MFAVYSWPSVTVAWILRLHNKKKLCKGACDTLEPSKDSEDGSTRNRESRRIARMPGGGGRVYDATAAETLSGLDAAFLVP